MACLPYGMIFTSILRDVSVREQSRIELEKAYSLLHATLEATADGIIAIDASKRITTINRKFLDMIGLSGPQSETQDFKLLRDHILDSVKELETIFEKPRQIDEHPESNSCDLVEFKDDRVFERYCNPQLVREEIVGSVHSFRDVTVQRNLIRDLNESLSRLSKKNRYESIISTINRSVTESHNLHEILDDIVETMIEHVESSNIVSIYFVEGQEAVLKANRGYPDWYIGSAGRIKYPNGFTWKAIIENRPLLYCSDVDQDTAIASAGRKLGTKSYVSMPIKEDGRIVGTINVHSFKKDAFDDEELKLLENIALQIQGATKKVRITEALRQSEERYRILFDQSPVGVYIFDTDLKVTQCNKRMVDILQTSYKNIVGFNIRDLKDKSFVPVTEETIRGRHSYREGLYETTMSGVKVWLSQYFAPLYDEEGNVIGGMGVAEDITERKETVRALEETKQRLNYLLSNSPAVIYSAKCTDDYETTFISGNITKVLGYQPEDFIGQPDFWIRNIHPDESEQILADLNCLFEKGKHTHEYRFQHKDGSYRWMLDDLTLIRNDDGNPLEVIGSWIDITERKKVEEALRKTQAGLSEAQRIAHLGNWDWDIVANELVWSNEIYRIFGLKPQEFGATYDAFLNSVHPHDREYVKRSVNEALYNGTSYSIDHKIVLPNGSERIVHEQAEVVFDDNGSPLRMIGTVLDITERKRLEEQLLQSQKMDAIGRLAGGIAHDFNNILTIILNYSDLLLSSLGKDKKQLDRVTEIKKAAERAANLTTQLLAFSRKQMLQPKVLDINTVVVGIEKMLRCLISENTELLILLDPEPLYVKADPGQIEQVIMNLAVNARDAMPKGGRIHIKTSNIFLDEASVPMSEDISPGRYVLFSLSDTGEGMDETILERIFEPFFTSKESGKGTGLGLATVYGIIKQSRGHIVVESHKDMGTTFKIYLPHLDEKPQPIYEEITPLVGAPRVHETIFIVEDQKEVLLTVSLVLQEAGYNVLEAHNGNEAIKISRDYKDPIDLLLIDVVMPGMSGPDLAILLGEIRPQTKVLYMSGYISDTIKKYDILQKGQSFIQKPFKPTELLHKISEVLDQELISPPPPKIRQKKFVIY